MTADDIKAIVEAIKSLNRQVLVMQEDITRMALKHELQEERIQYLSLIIQVAVARSEPVLSWEEVQQMEAELLRLQASTADMECNYNSRILNYKEDFPVENNCMGDD